MVHGGQYGGDVAMRKRAGNSESRLEVGGTSLLALQDLAESFNLLGRPVREVGEGAVANFAPLAETLAEEDGGWGFAIGDNGHVHVDILRHLSLQIKSNYRYYMTTLMVSKDRKLNQPVGFTCLQGWNFGLNADPRYRLHATLPSESLLSTAVGEACVPSERGSMT